MRGVFSLGQCYDDGGPPCYPGDGGKGIVPASSGGIHHPPCVHVKRRYETQNSHMPGSSGFLGYSSYGRTLYRAG